MGKDKNAPKGPMSSYACFVQVIREEHKKKHPDENVVFAEFSKKCAGKWKEMAPKEKKRFEDMAQHDKERFTREMNEYGGPGKKVKRAKDPNMPKRALSAFFFFCDEQRPKVRAMHPEYRIGDIAKEMGHRWEDCPNKEKYERLAMEDKARYETDMIAYKAGTFSGVTKRARVDDAEEDDE